MSRKQMLKRDDIEVKVDRMIGHLDRAFEERLISRTDYNKALEDLGRWAVAKRTQLKERMHG